MVRTFRDTSLVVLAGAAAIMIFALSAVAQAPSSSAAKRTPPPQGWMEKWVGWYDGQDSEGKNAPPGFRVLVPHRLNYEEALATHELDELELVRSLLQPWALARTDATDYEVEDDAQICRPSGPIKNTQTASFQVLVSSEKVTVHWTSGAGPYAAMRRIYLNRGHLANTPFTFNGDWVGHWEGATLVMDGTGFSTNTWISRDRARHSEALRVVERWRLVANNEWMERIITVDDRFALIKPFTMSRYHKKMSTTSNPRGDNVCMDTPDARKAWVTIHKRAVKEWEANGRKPLEGDVASDSPTVR